MDNNRDLSPSDAARALGSISTPRKTAAARLNARARNSAALPRPLTEIPCICGQCPDEDSPDAQGGKTTCPRGRAIYHRRRRAKAKRMAKP